MNTEYRKLLAFDGNNYYRRADSTPAFTHLRYNGKRVGAMYGCIKSILSDIHLVKPDEVAIAFDGYGAREKKQRIYAGYKSNRSSSMDDDLYQQMLETIKILKHAGLCVLHKNGVDGDDILGCLTTIKKRSVIIATSDKDLFQRCNSRVAVMRHIDKEKHFYYADTVMNKYGVSPKQFADYLALVGDGVDNIPGLHQCGPVLARKLLAKYGSVEDIVSYGYSIEDEKVRKRVLAQKDDLLAFKKLTKLDTSVISDTAMQTIIPRLTPKPYDNGLFPLLDQYGLKSLTDWFRRHRPTVLSKPPGLFS